MRTIIGIRREDKNLWERRVPLIPSHVKDLVKEHAIEICLQPSSIRIFPDQDYVKDGVKIEEDLSLCSIILAIKEIPVHFIKEGKVYLFFSHTIKGQPYNMPMLKSLIKKKCTLIDYERIMNPDGQRLLFFGKEAGQAGMINTLWALGQRLLKEGIENPFSRIKQAIGYISLVEAKEEIQKIGWEIDKKGIHHSLSPLVCGFAGYGHVSLGAQDILDLLPYKFIEPEKLNELFRRKNYSAHKIYKVVFKEKHMVKQVNVKDSFELQDYYQNPQKYSSIFDSYLEQLTVLVNCIYWEPKYPKFVTKKFLKKLYGKDSRPRLRVIGDITCDIEGAVECTLKATEPDNPVFTYNPQEDSAVDGFEGNGPVIMAVDNLPAEISLESSISFSKSLELLVPDIARADFSSEFESISLPDSVKRAVILHRGKFTPDYLYMEKFL